MKRKSAAGWLLPGPSAFRLYDTFGLALDEQEEMAREFGLAIDREGFEAEMERQRERARASWKGAERAQIAPVYQELLAQGRTKFLGYDGTEHEASVVRALVIDGQLAEAVPAGSKAELVLDQTPFYAEAGGQVGDCGSLSLRGRKSRHVDATFAARPGLSVHRIMTTALTARRGHADRPRRIRVAPRHDAQSHRNAPAARRLAPGARDTCQTGGECRGAHDRLRFDFSHYASVTPEELREIERLANEQILPTPSRDQRHADRAGARDGRHGAVRGEIRRHGSRRIGPGLQPGALRRNTCAAARVTSVSARSFTRARSPPVCAASKR